MISKAFHLNEVNNRNDLINQVSELKIFKNDYVILH
jgi:hypothetical protein